MRNLSVNIAGVLLKNPVTTASGTFGFGEEYAQYYNLSLLGAAAVKGLTLKEKLGNPPARIAETPAGMLNAIGLQNPGVDVFLNHYMPFLEQYDLPVIANIAGSTIEDYCRMAEKLNDSKVALIEMNISCPNVKEGGVAFGTNCDTVYKITKAVKERSRKPVIVKLSPNVTDIVSIAKSAQDAGADALSLINTLLGMRIDIHTRRPVLHNNVGGFSGPAVKPVALRMVWQVANAVNLPIIGGGGIVTGDDAIEFILAGATAISVGTASLVNPMAAMDILRGMEVYMDKYQIDDINMLRGCVQAY